MNERAVAIRLSSRPVMSYVRWARRTASAAVVLSLAALFVQPPVQTSAGVPAKADPALYAQAKVAPSRTFSVIVREAQPASTAAEQLVRSLGGHITHELSIVGGFSATVPGSAVAPLTGSPLVWRVWGDARVHMASTNAGTPPGPPSNAVWRQVIGLTDKQVSGYNGAGVGVALLDTGVVPVPDLVNHIVHVVDLTPEDNGLDTYGHGTHMAGIIAGDGTSSAGQFGGVAPGANLVSVKVAGANGATDVSVVMAGLQWIVTHKAQYNIRVLNLSFGTDSKQSYSVDPLDYAVEQAWRAGIFVVVAAGNQGSNAGTITKPADDPYVLTVGAADFHGTGSRGDDTVATFSSRGPTQDGLNKPDILAPGISIVSLRDAGSVIDANNPNARVGDSYFKGTGTSQAAAVTSGAAALLLQANPNMTPDVLKATLMNTSSDDISNGGGMVGNLVGSVQGSNVGVLRLNGSDGALSAAKSNKYQNRPANRGNVPSSGLGSLDASRGSLSVYADTNNDGQVEQVAGEMDAMGNAWSGNAWSGNAWSGNAWSGNAWSNVAWEGNAWSGNAWSGVAWSGNAWSGMGWDGNAWSGNSWNGNAWSGNAWSGNAWSGNAWSGNAWSSNAWSGNAWSGNAWSSDAWSSSSWS